jgi:hypothetical protein
VVYNRYYHVFFLLLEENFVSRLLNIRTKKLTSSPSFASAACTCLTEAFLFQVFIPIFSPTDLLAILASRSLLMCLFNHERSGKWNN